MLVVATQAKGSVLIHQKMFESRLFFVDKLIDMGAQIILCDPHRAVVIGHDRSFQLRGGNMTSPDIRAGIALLIAAMSADGISRIHNIEQTYQVFTIHTIENIIRKGKRDLSLYSVRLIEDTYLKNFVFLNHNLKFL
jgi:UDP-N-acetylglucosamine enolpyruvyl transferase